MKRKDILISLAIIAAAALTVWLYLQGKGYVEIDAGATDATLRVRRSWFSDGALIESGDGPVLMPARRLRPQRLNISMRQGDQTWSLYGSGGPWGKLSTIEVKSNETTRLRLGPPFLVKPRVSRSGAVVSIDYTIIGKAGEHYGASAMRNGRVVTGAKINIVDEAGNVLNTGRFEYG